MSSDLMPASASISLALVLYTLGVFTQRHRGSLTGPILALFWLGLVCDATGATLMKGMARSGGGPATSAVHGVTGAIAIVLMRSGEGAMRRGPDKCGGCEPRADRRACPKPGDRPLDLVGVPSGSW